MRRYVRVGPGAMGLALDGDRLYLAHPEGDEVWTVDFRRWGTAIHATAVDRGPIGVSAAVDRAGHAAGALWS